MNHHTAIRLLVVGTETAVFDTNSRVRERILASLASFASVDIVVLCGEGYAAKQATPSISLHPTNSITRGGRLFMGLWMGLRAPTADIVTVQDPFETGFVGWLVALVKRASLHVQVHTDVLSPEYARHSTLNWLRVLLAGFVLRRARRIRVVSERIRRDIEARYMPRASITVLPVFVDTERFRFALPDPERAQRFARFEWRVVVISRLESEKNVALAINTFAEYAPENACLIIVGDGSERESLEALSRSFSPERRIFFEGSRDPASYYKIADLVLLTSRYEGFGLVIAEALAAGKPVLATDVGMARELGAMVAPADELGEKLVEWFKHGSREGHLRNYPYKNFDEYVRAYTGDIAACAP